MKNSIFVSLLFLVFICNGNAFANNTKEKGMSLKDTFPKYQQTEDHTCGPAALLSIANYYRGKKEFPLTREMELKIAKEAGTKAWTGPNIPVGTNPEQMKNWLISKGFKANLEFESLGDESALKKVKKQLKKGIPCIVAWADWGGHWVIIIDYDDKGTKSLKDDTLTFYDPYDRSDGKKDGRISYNAYRFYWTWFEANCFNPSGPSVWRTLITIE